ncbi:MAG: Glucose 1-dehydrogenase [Pseudomonadota bacterium]|jgi:pteridine reductase
MSGRRVLITGAGQRVGAAMAQAFSAAGFSVLLHHRRSAAAAEALAASLSASGPPCATAGADLATVEGCAALAAAALAWAGDAPIDVLVNNASDYRPRPFGQIAAADLDGMMAIHARAPLLLAQALAPALGRSGLPGGGLVLNLVDIGAERPAPGFLPYAVSKAALVMLTRALALEMAPAVRVNAIAPGTVLAPEDLGPAQLAQICASVPLQRLGDPAAIASAAVFLATAAPYCTGVVLPVDGGRSLRGPLSLDLPAGG